MWRLYLMTISFTAVLVLALAVPLPRAARDMNDIGSILHVGAFATLAALLFRIVRQRQAMPWIAGMLACWMAVTALGLVTEWVQTLVGRGASWPDVWSNACGAGGGISWVQTRSMESSRWRTVLFIGVALMLVAGVAGPWVAQ